MIALDSDDSFDELLLEGCKAREAKTPVCEKQAGGVTISC